MSASGSWHPPMVVQEEAVPAREFVQIAAAGGDPNVLYALANDGTVWRLAVRLGYGWAQLPGLPEPDTEPAPEPGPVVTPSNPI